MCVCLCSLYLIYCMGFKCHFTPSTYKLIPPVQTLQRSPRILSPTAHLSSLCMSQPPNHHLNTYTSVPVVISSLFSVSWGSAFLLKLTLHCQQPLVGFSLELCSVWLYHTALCYPCGLSCLARRLPLAPLALSSLPLWSHYLLPTSAFRGILPELIYSEFSRTFQFPDWKSNL